MKILHTSDWHLGRLLHEHSLIEDQQYALSCIHEIIKKEAHDALIIAGDIFDRSIPSVGAVKLFSWFLSELRIFSDIPVVIIPGNHDSPERLSFCAEIFSLSGIHIKADPFSIDEPVRITAGQDAVNIYAIPFLDPHVYTSCSEEETEIQKVTHESAVAEAIDRIKQNMQESETNILTAHLFTAGGISADSERTFVGTAGLVDPALFSQFRYTALGHLHRPQQINEKTWYSGSLLHYSFSEHKDKKGVLSIDISSDKTTIAPIELSIKRGMARLKGTLNKMLNSPEFESHKNSYVEVELSDRTLVLNPLTQLRERFPFILSVRQAAPLTGMNSCKIETGKQERNIEDDYILFHNYICDEDPDPEKKNLFIKACRSVESHETA